MQKYVRIVKENPLYAVAGLLIVVVIVVAVFVSGGGGGEEQAKQAPTTTTKKKRPLKPAERGRRVKPPPVGRTGVIDEARREGPFVVAQARGTIRNPGQVRLRVSASPRQKVTVDWQLSCFRNRRVKVGRGKYRTRAPDTRAISVPMSGAETCIATAGAQLTRYGTGRVKVAVVAG